MGAAAVTIEFEIAGLPSTTNSGGRKHWSVKVKEAKKWKQAVAMNCAMRGVGIGRYTFIKAHLTLTRCSTSRPDFDGLVSGFKNCIDGLVECGAIPDDDHETIGVSTYLWEPAKRTRGLIRVKIEEIE